MCQCRIQWPFKAGEAPAPHDAQAVCEVRCRARVDQVGGRAISHADSEWFACCEEHAAMLNLPGMHHWERRDLPAAAPAPTFSHDELESALCVWEWIDGASAVSGSRWAIARAAVGASTLRLQCGDIGRFVDVIYDALPLDLTDGMAFDWEIVPEIIEAGIAVDDAGRVTIPQRPLDVLPMVLAVLNASADAAWARRNVVIDASLTDREIDDRIAELEAEQEAFPVTFAKDRAKVGELTELRERREWNAECESR